MCVCIALNCCKFEIIGGKRINYCLAGSYQARVARAVVQYNSRGCSGSTYQRFKNSTDTHLMNDFELSRKRKVEKNAVAKAAKPKKSRYSAPAKDQGVDYGEKAQTKDMIPRLFEIAKTRHMEQLLEDQKNRDFINQCTIGQHLVQKWRDMQNKLLTSRYFSRIINARGPESYPNIVEDIIYKKTAFSNTADNRHQNIHVKKALERFGDKHGTNYISECGLFVDREHCFLAASPFRLYGDNGVIFVRCPREAFSYSIKEAIEKKMIPFWKLVNGVEEVNKSSPWYIELQAELHVAERSFAFLVVFVESDVRIERICRDDDFWFDVMEKPLVFFYEQAMVKEQVDPRKSRSMKLRVYNAVTKTFE